MAQIYEQQGGGQNTAVASPAERDDEIGKGLQGTLSEAAERVTFHRVELERWQRIGRAAQAGLRELQSVAPVPKQSMDGFLEDSDGPMPSQGF